MKDENSKRAKKLQVSVKAERRVFLKYITWETWK